MTYDLPFYVISDKRIGCLSYESVQKLNTFWGTLACSDIQNAENDKRMSYRNSFIYNNMQNPVTNMTNFLYLLTKILIYREVFKNSVIVCHLCHSMS